MIDISNRKDIFDRLAKLTSETKQLWGKMSAQHMVEHLAFSLQVSDGKLPQILHNTEELAEKIKQKLIYTDVELPEGVKSPVLGDEPPAYVHSDLKTAIEKLGEELDYFDKYYQENPNAKHVQPRMGLFNHHEWTTLNNKHFTHHFKQFGLM